MAVSFDTLAAAEAMESAGVERRQARAIAAQMQAAAAGGESVTRPELEAALAALKTELLERIAESERGLIERIAESERGLIERIAESERGLIERIAGSARASTERTTGVERALMDRIAESERRMIDRTTVLLWRLFGGMVALVGLAVAALRYLPAP